MPLTSSSDLHNYYFQFSSILFDTCGLNWFAKRPNGLSELNAVAGKFLLLIPTPVLFELAFGAQDQVGKSESVIRKRFMDSSSCLDLFQYNFAVNEGRLPPKGFLILNPGFNEWWTARNRLLKYAEVAGATTRVVKRDLTFDSLIHAMARNTFSPICSENIDDFRKMNRAGSDSSHDGTVPIFHPEKVLESLENEVLYREE